MRRCPEGYTEERENDLVELIVVEMSRTDGSWTGMLCYEHTICRMWEHSVDMKKEAEGCCIERATASDYIHNRDE